MPEFSAEFWIGAGLTVLLALLGLGVGVGMDAKTKGEFRFVVVCFGLSALTVIYGIVELDMNTSLSFIWRMAFVCAACSIVVISLGESIRWVHARHLRASAISEEPPLPLTPVDHPLAEAGSLPSIPVDHAAKPPVPPIDAKPPTLESLFKSDVPYAAKIGNTNILQGPSGDRLNVRTQIYVDFTGKTKFVGYYIPHFDHTYEVCLGIVSSVKLTIEDAENGLQVTAGYKGEQTSLKDLTFSGRVLLYHEDFLSIPQKAEIIKTYTADGFDVNFRGPEYLGDQVVAWYHEHKQPKH